MSKPTYNTKCFDLSTSTSNAETLAFYRELEQRGYARGYAQALSDAETIMKKLWEQHNSCPIQKEADHEAKP
jgi:hypothetical protein